jgi:DNA-binding beta-propeller fold protein YncE
MESTSMIVQRTFRKRSGGWTGGLLSLLLAAPGTAQYTSSSPLPGGVDAPTAHYWAYVGAESADVLHRIRFGPDGAALERSFAVGEYAAEIEGPHGLVISPDAKYLYLTTGHGVPDGKLWKYELGADTLVAPGIGLGVFPASLDVTPDGLYTFSANFNLHGDMVPSTISVVYTPSMMEVARVVTCTMPHGSRIDPTGRFHYSGCMMDDQLVEIDTRSFEVSRRFSLAVGKEGPLPVASGVAMDHDAHGGHEMAMPVGPARGPAPDPAEIGYGEAGPHAMDPNSCSPTWAQPSHDGVHVYVACNRADEILEIHRGEWRVSRRFTTGRGPYNVDVTRDGRLLVATLKQGGMFEVFSLETGQSLARLENSTTVAHGIALTPDSRYAFVSSEGVGAQPGIVDIYDLEALVKVGTVELAQQTGGIAFWRMEPVGDR